MEKIQKTRKNESAIIINDIITIPENELLIQLKKFISKDISISFNSDITENIILQNIKVKKEHFTIIINSKTTNELFCMNLCDISNIWKTTDNKIIYVFSESVGKIKIELNNVI